MPVLIVKSYKLVKVKSKSYEKFNFKRESYCIEHCFRYSRNDDSKLGCYHLREGDNISKVKVQENEKVYDNGNDYVLSYHSNSIQYGIY